MRSKLKIIIPIAAAIIAIVLAAIFIQFKPANVEDVSLLVKTAQKYLLEMNYEQAIVEFEKSIALDPMNADAYIGLAEAYSGMGDIDKAVETLKLGYEQTGDERLKKMLEELLPSDDVEATTTVTTASETVTEAPEPEYVYMYVPNKVDFETTINYGDKVNYTQLNYPGYDYEIPLSYDANGKITNSIINYRLGYSVYGVNNSNGAAFGISDFDAKDSVAQLKIYEKVKKENEKNIEVYSGDGIVYVDVEYKYDENGTLIELIYYYAGTNDIYSYSKYDSHGNSIKSVYNNYESTDSYVYNSDGSVAEMVSNSTTYSDEVSFTSKIKRKYTYDSNGYCTKMVEKQTNKTTYSNDYYENTVEFVTEYFYNDDNNIVKEEKTENGEKYSTVVYEYDSNGNLISKTQTASYGTESEKYSYIRVKVLKSEVEKVKNEFGIELNVF